MPTQDWHPELASGSNIKGLSPNVILAVIFKNRLFFSKNFSAYTPYKPQNLFEKTITIFENFASKAHSATDP
jgi:hypothetical protein